MLGTFFFSSHVITSLLDLAGRAFPVAGMTVDVVLMAVLDPEDAEGR